MAFAWAALSGGLLFSSADANPCQCNGFITPPSEDPFKRSSNIATTMGQLLLYLLPGVKAPPARILALVSTSMYDAYACSAQTTSRPTTQCSKDASRSNIIVEDAIAFAAFSSMKKVFMDSPSKIKLLTAVFIYLGYNPDKPGQSGQIGLDSSDAVFKKFMLGPKGNYMSVNKPSTTNDASCSTLKDPSRFQGVCVQDEPGEACVPQMWIPNPILNGPLFSAEGNNSLAELTSSVPPPPSLNGSLPETPPLRFGESEYFNQILTVLAYSGVLNDRRKASAEFFAPNAAITMFRFGLAEVSSRKLGTAESTKFLFSLGVALNDAFIATASTKAKYDTVRPLTILQCAYRGARMRAWREPYMGVQTFTNGEGEKLWTSYQQTPGFPGYTSGHSAVGAAGSFILTKFFGEGHPRSANCFRWAAGTSMIEPRIEKGARGYIAGITNVPNQGPGTKGYSPGRNATMCWRSWTEMSVELANSRLYAGIHIPADNREGYILGRKAGRQAFQYTARLFRGY